MALAPNPLYKADSPQAPSRPERRGVSRRRVIDEAKVKVPVIDLADRLAAGQRGGWHKVGAEWVRRCVLDDHEDKTPSFSVNPDKNVWICRGCLRGGDVIELARFAWGYSKAEVPMAAAQLLHEFGHPIPPRPESWYRKQERQAPIRAGIEHVRREILLRRLFKWCVLPMLDAIRDEHERQQELERAWADFREVLLP
jgi:hypothetical protein